MRVHGRPALAFLFFFLACHSRVFFRQSWYKRADRLCCPVLDLKNALKPDLVSITLRSATHAVPQRTSKNSGSASSAFYGNVGERVLVDHRLWQSRRNTITLPPPRPPTPAVLENDNLMAGWVKDSSGKWGPPGGGAAAPGPSSSSTSGGGGGVGALTAKFGGPASGGGSRYGEAAGKFGGGVNGSGGGGRAPPPVPVVKKQPPPLPSRGGGGWAGVGGQGCLRDRDQKDEL